LFGWSAVAVVGKGGTSHSCSQRPNKWYEEYYKVMLQHNMEKRPAPSRLCFSIS
jgi:hypothetical protein